MDNIGELERAFFKQEFDASFEAPVNLVTNPVMKSTSGTVEVARNLFLSPTPLENSTASPTDNVIAYAGVGAFVEFSSDHSWVGSRSYKVVATSPEYNSKRGIRHKNLNVPAGTTINPTIRIYWPSSNQGDVSNAQVSTIYRDDITATSYSGNVSPTVGIVEDQWIEFSFTHTVPSATTLTSVYFELSNIQNAAVTDVIYFDGWQSNTGDYFSGDTQDDETFTYSWTGTPHASESIKTAKTAAGWTFNAGAFTPYVVIFDGKSCLYTEKRSGTSDYTATNNVYRNNLEAGKTYNITVELFNPSSNLTLAGIRSGGGVSNIGDALTGIRGVWTKVKREFTVVDPLTVTFFLYAPKPIYVSNFMIVPNDYDGGYFDGDSPVAEWTGEPHASTSRLNIYDNDLSFQELNFFQKNSGLSEGSLADHERAYLLQGFDPFPDDNSVVVRKNLAINPSFELNDSGWTQWNGTGGTFTPSVITGGAKFGSNFKRLTCSVPPTSGAGHRHTPTTSDRPYVKPNTKYTVSVWIRSNISTSFYIQTSHFTADHTALSTDGSSPITVSANTWTLLTWTFTSQPNQSYVQVSAYGTNLSNMVAGDTFDIDGLCIQEGESTDYFDGDSQYARWTGTPHASMSELTDPTRMGIGDLRTNWFKRESGLPSDASPLEHEIAFYKNKLGIV